MADPAGRLEDDVAAIVVGPRHSVVVRVTHWITALCIFALVISGVEIIISHPRFYWGEDGNVLTPPLFRLPIPASRRAVNTGYGFVLPDQNGWSRNLHFQAAWVIVLTGFVYVTAGVVARHFRKNLIPTGADLRWKELSKSIAGHIRFRRPDEAEASNYNVLQRLSYVFVIFVLMPLAIWTGLAMSPAMVSVFPSLVTVFGGQQSARTIHFFVSVALVLFVLIHILMVWRAGFKDRTRAIITGGIALRKESR